MGEHCLNFEPSARREREPETNIAEALFWLYKPEGVRVWSAFLKKQARCENWRSKARRTRTLKHSVATLAVAQ